MAEIELIAGGALAQAVRGLKARLLEVFPTEQKFTHAMVPPAMSPARWDQITKTTPFIGLSWKNWTPRRATSPFIGDALFGLFIVVRNRLDWQLLGDATQPGLLGVVTVAVAALDDYLLPATLDGETPLGTCRVTECGGLFSEEWVSDTAAMCGLNIVIPNVSITDGLRDKSVDFLKLGQTWSFGGDPTKADVLNVRGEN